MAQAIAILTMTLLLLAGCGGGDEADEGPPICEYETASGELRLVECDVLEDLHDRMGEAETPETPPLPQDFDVTCGFTFCSLTFNDPWWQYTAHKQTVVWRAESPDFRRARQIAAGTWLNYFDNDLPHDTAFHYWIGFVNTAGIMGPVAGPAEGRTGIDIEAEFEQVRREVQEDPLTKWLTTPITDMEPRYVVPLDRLELHDTLDVDVRSGRTCTDEYEQAYNYSTVNGFFPHSVPALWDGTPFIVDISDGLEDPHGLLAMIQDEAELLEHVLGYPIFVAGDVLPLANVGFNDVADTRSLAPDYRIEVRCCQDRAGDLATAHPWVRQILLDRQPHLALIHELYHVLGLGHDTSEGVPMSGPLLSLRSWSEPTRSTESDWANLACIYD